MNSGIHPGFGGDRPVELYLPEIIYEETLQANGAFDIRDIPLIYEKFEMEARLRSSVSATAQLTRLWFNGDTTQTNYRRVLIFGNGASASSEVADEVRGPTATGATAPSNTFSHCSAEFLSPQNGMNKDFNIFQSLRMAASGGGGSSEVTFSAANWENTAPITRIQLQTANHPTDLFVKGSMVRLLGWRRFRLQP